MFKGIIFSTILAVSSFAMAEPTFVDVVTGINHQQILDQAQTTGLNWKVGETNNYSIDMGFIKGSMVMSVREIVADGVWLDQNIDLGFAGKQVVQTLLDPNTGEIKIDLFREGIGESSKATHPHPHRKIGALDVGR